MRWITLLLVAFLPTVMLASVTVTSTPASADAFIGIARESFCDGDYVTAFAMYEYALRRDPHSSEAFIGRLMAMAFMKGCSAERIELASR